LSGKIFEPVATSKCYAILVHFTQWGEIISVFSYKKLKPRPSKFLKTTCQKTSDKKDSFHALSGKIFEPVATSKCYAILVHFTQWGEIISVFSYKKLKPRPSKFLKTTCQKTSDKKDSFHALSGKIFEPVATSKCYAILVHFTQWGEIISVFSYKKLKPRPSKFLPY
jgi:Cu/Ag efflux pump CusA